MKDKDKVIGYIYETKDYSKFKILEENRLVTKHRLRELIDSIGERNLPSPILVNEGYEIIDGQGRLEARKTLGLPITYMIEKGLGIAECRHLNACMSNWTDNDFCFSYAMGGNENYQRLVEAQHITSLPFKMVYSFSGRPSYSDKGNGGKYDNIRNGRAIFTPDDKEKAINIYDRGIEIQEALKISTKSNAFWRAFCYLYNHDKYNHERMLKKCKKTAGYETRRNVTEQLVQFEEIYNFGVPKKDRVYFSDILKR